MPSKDATIFTPLDPTKPIHEQIRLAIARSIESGALKPGDKLPSEAELQRAYKVSRTPVRQALTALEAADLIYSAQGRGSFVRRPMIVGRFGALISFGDELRDEGHAVEAKTLSVNMTTADEAVAPALDLAFGEAVIALRRLFLVDGEPMALFDHRIRPVISLQVLERGGDFLSLNSLLSQQGFAPAEAMQTIGATSVTTEEAGLLGVDEGTPSLLVKQTSFTAAGMPVSYAQFLVRADRYEYRVHLGRRAPLAAE
ncbi:MAG TPA: GntR family transcriptional regulator [bacterium]